MRVLLVTANFRPSVGGIERFVEILAHGLAERGHEVTVATCRNRGGARVEEDGAVRIVRIPASDLLRRRLGVPYPIPAPRAAVRTLRGLVRRADVVHAQDALYLTTVAALALARREGVPSVLTQHVAFVPQGNAALDLVQRAAIRTIGRSARFANVVATFNPSVAEWARRTWQLSDVRLLPAGVPPPPSPPDRDAVRHELGLPDDAFLVLFAGRDVPKKRLDVFLAASDPAYELVAVTDRPDAGSSLARLVPFMSSERFARLLAAADAFVLPSEGEGFPLALQEALIAGVPCVVTRGPGYDRFLSADDAIFVPPEAGAIREALLRLVSDPAYRLEIAGRARAVGERSLGLEAWLRAYVRLYEELRARTPSEATMA
ncbi:MAG: glycosyltransferase family 4 protein [Gemmatimonadota bacterium]